MTYVPEGWVDNSLATPVSAARLTYMEQGISAVDTATAAKATALVPTSSKTANYTAVSGDLVLCDATSAGFAIALPSAAAGLLVAVRKTDSSANQVTVTGTSVVLKAQYQCAIFIGTAAGWVTQGELLSLSILDARYSLSGSGGTPLVRTNNLSDLSDTSAARSNLGLGSAAQANIGTASGTVAAGNDSRLAAALQATNNLSDLASAGTARTNLGLGGAALLAVGTASGTVAAGNDTRISGALQAANSLSDVANVATARANLGLGTAATKAVGTASGTVAAGDDSRFSAIAYTDAQARAAMPLYLPADHGYLGWSMDPTAAGTGQAVTAGVLILMEVKIVTAGTVNTIDLMLSSVGGTLTNSYAALFNTSGSRLGVSADQSSSWGGGSAGPRSSTLTAGASVTAGFYYVGLLVGSASTLPSFARSVQSLITNVGRTAAPYRSSTSGTGQTAMPATVTMSSTAAAREAYWVGVKT